MAIQSVNNGETYGVIRGKLNSNFTEIDSRLNNAVDSQTIRTVVTLTQAAYDALTPAADTLYVITD